MCNAKYDWHALTIKRFVMVQTYQIIFYDYIVGDQQIGLCVNSCLGVLIICIDYSRAFVDKWDFHGDFLGSKDQGRSKSPLITKACLFL